jgi:hypothetical protein
MGQAAVDLPNSPDVTPAPLAGADDLLSQMAGAEIDRLLAEAGETKPGTSDAAVFADKPIASAEAPAKPASPFNSAQSVTGAAEDAYAAELEAVFQQMEANQPPPAPVVVPVDQATTHAELSALSHPMQSLDALAELEEKPSPVVRLLELLNAPFAFVPDAARDTLGKIAILTLMNAIGVLLYLFLFKR